MLIIKDISNLQSYLSAYQNRKYSIGYVPTMGALHKGHGELIKQSKKDNHKTIVSIFVNEKQFSNKEDFETYPRNKGFDYDFCTDNEVDILFEPSSEEIFKNLGKKFIDNGATILGGCCETSPKHISALSKLK